MSLGMVFGPCFAQGVSLSCDPNTQCVKLDDGATYTQGVSVSTDGESGTSDSHNGQTPVGAEMLDQGAIFTLNPQSGGGTWSSDYGVITALSYGGNSYEEGDAGDGGGIRLDSAGQVDLAVSSSNEVSSVLYARSLGGSGPADNGNNDSDGGSGGWGGSISVVTYLGSRYQVVGDITQDMSGIFVASLGGSGGAQNSGTGDQLGGAGGDGHSVTIDSSSDILFGIPAQSGNAAQPVTIASGALVGLIRGDSKGGDGGKGNGDAGAGGDVTIHHNAGLLQIVAAEGDGTQTVYGVRASSEGATGYGSTDDSDPGGTGGGSGNMTVDAYSSIDLQTPGMMGAGIQAETEGGQGGESPSKDESGGSGGVAGSATVTAGDMSSGNTSAPLTISTTGSTMFGIQAVSKGGFGGDGADSTVLAGEAGGGGLGGNAGVVTVNVGSNATVTTSGDYSSGVTAWSVGGGGGTGGDFIAILGGSGSKGGDGGESKLVTVTNNGTINTTGDQAFGIDAQSNSGGGGAGGIADGLIVELGGDGGIGGAGGGVTIRNTGTISTTGSGATGISAQSNGGGGGNAGGAGGIIAVGGNPRNNDLGGSSGDGTGGTGGLINIANIGTITTVGDAAEGILAQSIGGGGGKASDTINGIVAVGGSGAAAGNGGGVYFIADTQGTISTSGDYSYGINAQSIGGGGGNGGSATGVAAGVGVAVGGNGAAAGNGGYIQFNMSGDTASSVTTQGDNAHGILAQSIGGGGGSAGDVLSVGASFVDIVVGGSGAAGGNGGLIDFDWSNLSVTTSGIAARGIMLQSVGGGGGTGGGVRGDNLSLLGELSTLVGADGGDGGYGEDINGTILSSTIVTGLAVPGTQTASSTQATDDDDDDSSPSTNALTTDASAISMQSIGGGGGAGGSVTNQVLNYGPPVFAGGAASMTMDFAVGGRGGEGGHGGTVGLTVAGTSASTAGQFAHGVFMQSIGGGGGDGGSAQNYMIQVDTGDVSVGVEADAAVGGQCIRVGKACAGGDGNQVTVNLSTNGYTDATILNTSGDYSNGVLAQSIGGGGGDGGSADSYAFGFQTGIAASVAATTSVGSKGGAGGGGGTVTVNTGANAQIKTTGSGARGIVAQSIGGGGGTGQGTSAYLSGSEQATKVLSVGLTLDVGVGMKGGSGGDSKMVTVNQAGEIVTTGRDSDGILAQAVGGGGGIGGSMGADPEDTLDVISNALQTLKDHVELQNISAEVQVSVGGQGGDGGVGGTAVVNNSGVIHTFGEYADGIVAQSIGGGGGTGGGSTSQTYVDWFDANVSVGGSGGVGGDGGAATVNLQSGAQVRTVGYQAYGILAHSIGGGGGQGGNGTLATKGRIEIGAGVGGGGGEGSDGGTVTFTSQTDKAIQTNGNASHAVALQSIGGGGGIGGLTLGTGGDRIGYSLDMSMSIGGSGGSGGNGGQVNACTNNSCKLTQINTTGHSATALLAQSVGGGGGDGVVGIPDQNAIAAIGLNLAALLGGGGGDGGDGGNVNIGGQYDIETFGPFAHGIAAQSIGGGGGMASSADTVSEQIGISGVTPAIQVLLSVGSEASGSGGNANAVDIDASGSVVTVGDGSHGIVAQSIGGGGGLLGTTLSDENLLPEPPQPDPDDPNNPNVPWLPGERYLTLGSTVDDPTDNSHIGDSGVAGSSIPAVSITYDGVVQTMGDWSMGVLAQSIGGGGGAAHSGVTPYGQLGAGAATIRVGSPNMTGAGGDVALMLSPGQNGIVTAGNGSYGVLAQSISDGGGLGTGMVFDSAAQMHIGGGSSTLPSEAVAAGHVGVQAQSQIYTLGTDAIGLAAQAIGGGGGVGGVLAWEGTTLMGAELRVGGYWPGQGGGVSIDTNQTINTKGNRAYGVVAQSIGGGGGIGVIGVSDARAPDGLTVQIGGSAADGSEIDEDDSDIWVQGADAGGVQFDLDGTIATAGRDADGALIQAIGGGGGLSGATGDQSGALNPSITPAADTAYALKLILGADNNYGNGGNIGSTQQAARMAAHTTTTGDFADGLVLQSVGGGGGQGGVAAAGGTIVSALTMQVGGGFRPTADMADLSTQGGPIVLAFNDEGDGTSVHTKGYAANGVVVQSIGGGGGIAGASAPQGTGTIQVGATNEVQGNGGDIQITPASYLALSTQGDSAHGLVVQSIGGGGGIATVDSRTSDATTGVGQFKLALGGSGGNGGNIELSTGGNFTTAGQGAIGMIAQSIGGGGGIATTGGAATLSDVTLGSSLNASSGDGQTVTVTLQSDGMISTSGAGSHGVVAQSIGSGGGILGDLTQTVTTSNSDGWDLVTGQKNGSGGEVTVTVSNVTTTGMNAFGVIAQSLGGGGGLGGSKAGGYAGETNGDESESTAHAGNVSVTVNGTVSATGENSTGVLAQRQASSNSGVDGSITVNVNGIVRGGSGSGVGIWVSNGAYSTSPDVINVAENAQLSAVSDNALRNDGSSPLTTNNAGNIQGNALCEEDVCILNSSLTGTLTHAEIYQADVTTAGKLIIGRPGSFGHLTVAGDFAQTSTGIILADADFLGMRASNMTVEGDAQLDGRVGLNAVTLLPDRELTLVNVQGNSTGELHAVDTPIFDFDIQQAGNEHRVSVKSADFNASSMDLARNQSHVAGSLQDIWDRGGNAEMAPLFAVLNDAAAQGASAYNDRLSDLSPGVALAPAAQMAVGMARFTESMMSCPAMDSVGTDGRERDCVWGQVTRRSTSQDAANGTSDFSFDSTTYQVGGQFEFKPGWFVGGSLAYQNNSLRGKDSRASGNGDAGYAGVVLKYQDGPWVYSGAIGAGYGSYDMNRNLNISGYDREAGSDPDVYSAGARLRAARHIGLSDQFYLKPYVDLDLIYTRMPSYTESGDALSLKVDSSDQFQVGLSPMLEIGGRVDLPNGATMRPYAYAGASFLSDDSWDASARFSGAPAGSDQFSSTLAGDHVVGRVGVGMQVNNRSGLDFRLQYDGEFSSKATSHAGQLKVMYRF
ncbi:hypothetical protein GCM10027288_46640 [Bordetella tumbae]